MQQSSISAPGGTPAAEPENDEEPTERLFATISRGGSYTGVAEALRQSYAPELVSDWRCEACAGLGGVKCIKYQTLPRLLAVQLNRFDPVPHGLEVISERVPVVGELDLAGHLEPPCADDGPPGPEAAPDPSNTRFRLRSLVEFHPGGGGLMSSGHDTCWVRDDAGVRGERWVEYDDSTVRPAQPRLPESVHTGAYLLLYERAAAPPPAGAEPGGAAAAGAAPDVIMEDI